jgi:hypothetical protein
MQEFFVRPETRGNGSVWQAIGSADDHQAYLLVPDGENNVVWILNRADGSVVSTFGHSGRNAGQFHWVHVGGLDSDGNFYLGEVDTGKRLQKFVLKHGQWQRGRRRRRLTDSLPAPLRRVEIARWPRPPRFLSAFAQRIR